MRTKIFALILIFFMAILLAGLVRIQICRHEKYRVMSEGNRLRIVLLRAPRGSIFDRNGNVLVKDTLCFNVAVIYGRIKDMNSIVDVLNSVLDIPKEKIAAKIEKCRRRSYSPVCIVADIGMEKAVHMEEAAMDHPGILLEVSAKREYIYGNVSANILGHLGPINRFEFKRLRPYDYRMDDLVGRDGVEKYYDEYLRGVHGGKQIEVDHRGREAMTLGFKEPSPGRDVYLTIDLELQKYCDKLLEGKRGAILVMNPQNGAMLAMASAPAYDPGIFVDNSRKQELEEVLKSRNYPLLNRAISCVYPPGSVFKAVIVTAALEAGVATPATTFSCPGYLTLGRTTFRCWKKNGHGTQELKEAIKNSCNVYFFRLGLLLGADKIAEFSERFGFGARTGIDLSGEKQGIRPTRSWKKDHFREKWYKGDTVNYSIGQGYLLVSPIQMVRMMSVFANEGYLVKPYVVSKVGDISVKKEEKIDLEFSPKTIETVRDGLRKVVNDPRGTGMKAKLKHVVVAGKTGTAQSSKGKDHGWFAGFAPFGDEKLTVVVFDEYGGKGGYYAAQTAGKVLKKAKELGLM